MPNRYSRFAHEFPQSPFVFHEYGMCCGSALDHMKTDISGKFRIHHIPLFKLLYRSCEKNAVNSETDSNKMKSAKKTSFSTPWLIDLLCLKEKYFEKERKWLKLTLVTESLTFMAATVSFPCLESWYNLIWKQNKLNKKLKKGKVCIRANCGPPRPELIPVSVAWSN